MTATISNQTNLPKEASLPLGPGAPKVTASAADAATGPVSGYLAALLAVMLLINSQNTLQSKVANMEVMLTTLQTSASEEQQKVLKNYATQIQTLIDNKSDNTNEINKLSMAYGVNSTMWNAYVQEFSALVDPFQTLASHLPQSAALVLKNAESLIASWGRQTNRNQ